MVRVSLNACRASLNRVSDLERLASINLGDDWFLTFFRFLEIRIRGLMNGAFSRKEKGVGFASFGGSVRSVECRGHTALESNWKKRAHNRTFQSVHSWRKGRYLRTTMSAQPFRNECDVRDEFKEDFTEWIQGAYQFVSRVVSRGWRLVQSFFPFPFVPFWIIKCSLSISSIGTKQEILFDSGIN